MKKILGLDVGTNSIGAALINVKEFGQEGNIEWMGSRIIPLDGDSLSKFENGGQVETKAANRRILRGSRRLKQRYKQRRTRLIEVFKILGWVKDNFPVDFKEAQKENKFNINDFLPISDVSKKQAYEEFGTEKISEDWLVYFLRKKALSEEITTQELARIIYMLNQRRGFKSSRREIKAEEENLEEKWPKIDKWIEILDVVSINELSKEKDKIVFLIIAGNYKGEILRKVKPDWEGKQMELEVIRKTTKAGEVTFSFKIPETSDWEKQKAALHKDIYEWMDKDYCKTIGEYFFIHLKENKNYRIRQRIVERELYKKELNAIWEHQLIYHGQLKNIDKLDEIAQKLYKININKQKEILNHDLLHLISEDIIYYQRKLKSQKHSIDVCRFEKRHYKKDGEKIAIGVKVAPKSSPEFQEFRIWQDIHNLRIYENETTLNGSKQIDVEITSLIDNEVKAAIFKLFDNANEISSNAILKVINKNFSDKTHKINLFANREKLKGNETKTLFRKVFKKHNYEKGESILADTNVFYKLWHILYSLDEVKDMASALSRLKRENGENIGLPNDVIDHLCKLPELPKQYAAYSSKAIKKLLPLMRSGIYWQETQIEKQLLNRINKIIDGEFDETLDDKTRLIIEKFGLRKVEDFSGLPTWLVTYIVYGKHAERSVGEKYTTHEQILVDKLIPPNSLRNPFAEQIIREALQIVKDVFENYGQPDEIHIELARELKKTSEEKAQLSKANSDNFAEKERIKKLLLELREGNPRSAADIEKFRLWKANGGFESNKRFEYLFNKKNEFVSPSEIEKYRLWADQNHLSPYTGKPIPLSLLFNKDAYEIEHIFPRSRFFDDSFANKVICETGVNKEKGARIARVFIQQGVNIFENGGNIFKLLDDETYVAHCKRIFKGKKLRLLLAETIPDDFVSRQLNDTRHISKKLAELLYPIAKDNEGVIFTGGSITAELKDKWGLNKVWKEILKPRFERLEKKSGEVLIVPDDLDVNKYHFVKDYKRVDHRHHAMDALIIAATSREHIRYLNTLNATDDKKKVKFNLVKTRVRDFIQPWPNFTEEAKEKLNQIIVSHKATNRVVTKPFNKHLKWVEKDGTYKKEFVFQKQPAEIGKTWTAVRRSMFKEPQGAIYIKEISLKRINEAIEIQIRKEKNQNKKNKQPADYIYDQTIRQLVKKLIREFKGNIATIKIHLKKQPLKDLDGNLITTVKVAVFKEYAAKRVTLDASFDEKKINKIPYANHIPTDEKKPTLPQILKQHLQEQGKPELAFIGEGLDVLHKKIGYQLKKVTIYEEAGSKIPFKGKLYETDKGGNVFFVINEDLSGKRNFYTIPIIEAIERLSNKLPLVDNQDGFKNIILSPNELVYLPEDDENTKGINWSDTEPLFDKIYKVVSFTKSQCFFVPHFVSKSLSEDNIELGANNKSERSWNGAMIKNTCIKIKIDRLGRIQPI